MTGPQRATPHARGQFQSTPSVWRETHRFRRAAATLAIFQSTPSVWRETASDSKTPHNIAISIHSLRVEGDARDPDALIDMTISIHSLRVEGDCTVLRGESACWNFNPLPPCGGRRFAAQGNDGGRRCVISTHITRGRSFQSTPSVWRETLSILTSTGRGVFQSTPSVWRETSARVLSLTSNPFQSTPSVWRETFMLNGYII